MHALKSSTGYLLTLPYCSRWTCSPFSAGYCWRLSYPVLGNTMPLSEIILWIYLLKNTKEFFFLATISSVKIKEYNCIFFNIKCFSNIELEFCWNFLQTFVVISIRVECVCYFCRTYVVYTVYCKINLDNTIIICKLLRKFSTCASCLSRISKIIVSCCMVDYITRIWNVVAFSSEDITSAFIVTSDCLAAFSLRNIMANIWDA